MGWFLETREAPVWLLLLILIVLLWAMAVILYLYRALCRERDLRVRAWKLMSRNSRG